MIYATGDMHGDRKKLSGALRKLRKGDTLLIAGDFGFIWDGSKREQRLLSRIGGNRFDICFVDGANENHELLAAYPEEEYMGGKARRICGNLRYLMRGEVYTIEDKKIFCFGGAKSEEIEAKQSCGHWYAGELPDEEDFRNGAENLEKNDYTVDYILTHQPSGSILASMEAGNIDCDNLQIYLDEIGKRTKYTLWVFGRMHRDRRITYKCQAVFNDVICLNPPTPKREAK